MKGDYASHEARKEEIGTRYKIQPRKSRALNALNDSLSLIDSLKATYENRIGHTMSNSEQAEFNEMIDGLQGIVENVYQRTDKRK